MFLCYQMTSFSESGRIVSLVLVILEESFLRPSSNYMNVNSEI